MNKSLFHWDMEITRDMLDKQHVTMKCWIQAYINRHGKEKVLAALGNSLVEAGFSNNDFTEPDDEKELNRQIEI